MYLKFKMDFISNDDLITEWNTAICHLSSIICHQIRSSVINHQSTKLP